MFKSFKVAAIMASTLAAAALARDDMGKTMEEICLENGFKSE